MKFFYTTKSRYYFLIFLFLHLAFWQNAQANFHRSSWASAFIPGGGYLFIGEYSRATKDAAIELGSFGLGYSMVTHDSFSLDGTKIIYPMPSYDGHEKDASKPLSAAVLQEFGLKYHMVNTFSFYRDQYNKTKDDPGQGFDQRTINEMFKDPFRAEVLSSPWVYIPIIFTGGFIYYDYHNGQHKRDSDIAPLKSHSKLFAGFNQMAMYPIGSAVPEETFYRGFIQNEFYYLVRSPYFSIPMSSLIFTLSHNQEDWSSAFASGLYLGMLAYKNNGDLSLGNAVHFWGVVILGIETYILTLNRQTKNPPPALNFSFTY